MERRWLLEKGFAGAIAAEISALVVTALLALIGMFMPIPLPIVVVMGSVLIGELLFLKQRSW
jgi:hypothetical protein